MRTVIRPTSYGLSTWCVIRVKRRPGRSDSRARAVGRKVPGSPGAARLADPCREVSRECRGASLGSLLPAIGGAVWCAVLSGSWLGDRCRRMHCTNSKTHKLGVWPISWGFAARVRAEFSNAVPIQRDSAPVQRGWSCSSPAYRTHRAAQIPPPIPELLARAEQPQQRALGVASQWEPGDVRDRPVD